MKHQTGIWVVLALIGLLVLALLPPAPIRSPRARASRVSGVNTLHSVSLTMTNASTSPGDQPGNRQ